MRPALAMEVVEAVEAGVAAGTVAAHPFHNSAHGKQGG